jgi:YegS/Rv2252/BmrU family lipid kinase
MTRPRQPRTFVVVNPASAAGATGRRWDRIACQLSRAIGSFDHAITEAPRHATALARAALGDGFELVVAVGGDGTLNEVACGFFEGRRPVAAEASLGVIPHGTGCDLVRAIGVGATVEDACARLSGDGARLIDVGHARFTGHDGRDTERVFLNEASFGCGGAVAHAITRGTKRLGRRPAFVLATARALLRYRDQTVTVTVDDGTPEQLAITNYAVCNGQYFGGGMWIAPDAELDDGRLDVTVWTGFGLRDFLLKRRALYDGRHRREHGTRLLRTRKVHATSQGRVLLEVDGESVGRLPAAIEILPRLLRFKT